MAVPRFESYQVAVDLVGSFLNSRYPNTNPDTFTTSYYGVSGSVLVLVRR